MTTEKTKKPETHPRLSGNRCQCTACGEFFNRVSTFDKHRVGRIGVDRRCLTPEEMRANGWRLNAAGFWITAKSNWRNSA